MERDDTVMASEGPSEVNASENKSGSSTDEHEKKDANTLAKVQSLFGEAIYEALQSKKYFIAANES